MGMAASQARYLGLTARKTNVEYEGQQINQARTALANQSANTFNELLALEVPTAPSTQDYTTLQYSYKDGTTAETITDMTEITDDPDYNYLITHYHTSDVYTAIQNKLSNPQVLINTAGVEGSIDRNTVQYDAQTDAYTINGVAVNQYDPLVEDQRANYEKICQDYPSLATIDPTNIMVYTDTDGVMKFTTGDSLQNAVAGTADAINYSVQSGVPTYVGNCKVSAYDATDPEQKAAYEKICEQFPTENFATSNNIYTWEYQGRRFFASAEDLTSAAISAPDQTKPTERQNKLTAYYAENVETKIEQTQRAFVDLDESGRPQSIRFEDSSATYALSTETKTDENAYNDAMNQYNYDMQVYEKRIADINAKTEKIQEQDRTLELRLRQLDTEQEALQTEMESVKKVIDKNIESTFKTFG